MFSSLSSPLFLPQCLVAGIASADEWLSIDKLPPWVELGVHPRVGPVGEGGVEHPVQLAELVDEGVALGTDAG